MAAKDISISTFLSSVTSLAVVIPILWYIGKPLISEALAEDFKQIAQDNSQPIKSAFSVLLTRDINALRKEIAGLKFLQRQGEDWTADDAEYLADLEIELEALKEAKEELKGES